MLESPHFPSSDDAGRSHNDIDKMIHALNAGFTQLGEQSKEQSERLIHTVNMGFTRLGEQNKEHTDRLQMTIEAQTPDANVNRNWKEDATKPHTNINAQPASTDTKTKFWTLYKKLADEQDKEFVDKYSADLENSLIFAGLFSAVTSVFIIQIQPEIQSGTSTIVLVTLCLLYFSLGMTLLASLLTVLGKQWVLHYSAAGEKGTIEARGLERQRKLDGLHKWKFDIVMQAFPLLLQVVLLLFSTALSIYLWKIHRALALIVLFFDSTWLHHLYCLARLCFCFS
ncbi:hypothetical protein C8R44DRAFT_715294 [Mycena epipterygia]|nr:hypothetical protein C8R44DRAFT_715294 [Mycena epipterygia]